MRVALFFAAFVAALAFADEEVVIPVDETEEDEVPVEMETNFIPELPTSEEMSETPTEPQSSSWHSRKYQRKHSLLAQRLDRSLEDGPVGEKWFEQVSLLSPFSNSLDLGIHFLSPGPGPLPPHGRAHLEAALLRQRLPSPPGRASLPHDRRRGRGQLCLDVARDLDGLC